ncbi:MAG: XRE family transcriptional regulator [candidate division Zixibacteria bacterium]|nr:XRE family transcriptional regulator [candidate division Zixibacteria bacterium]
MELREKIKQIRQEKKMSREELYERLLDIFGDKAVKPNTIWRIESGLTSARASSLHQLCIGLGVSLKELLGDIEPESKLVDMVKKGQRVDQYVYNQKAQAEILTPSKITFLAEELNLLPGGQTRTEENPIEIGKFQKWVYCLTGRITCVVGTERHTLDKGDCLSFESNIPHYFENNSSRKSRCLIVQNPRYI